MQCSSCGFECIPGSENCGRCGSSLRVGTLVMDVQPPRAGKFSKRLRRVLPARRAMYVLRDGFDNSPIVKGAAAIRRSSAELYGDRPAWGLVWRLIVPGWSHFHAGQRIRGHVYLWSFVALLLPGLLLMGTTWGSVLLGLAFSVHASAAFDVFNQTAVRPSLREMMARSILITMALGLCLYLPVRWAISRAVDVRTIELTAHPLAAGDVVVVNRLIHPMGWPAPGDVVLYRIPELRTPMIRGPRGNAIYEFRGERVDRVLATSGDRVSWAGGVLTVNGKPSPVRPLNPAAAPALPSLTVPEGAVLIIPSTTPNVTIAADAGYLQALSFVPREDVLGTVVLRKQPLSRFGWIR